MKHSRRQLPGGGRALHFGYQG
ncbi:hypothetical protein PSHT_00103 [Puccinia striiformis]|uniref:Uncharacterized protein n=1 Tax=Puccinia striiformis TaxID=27350 RepID=A0A2S4WP30_9BASI|nr:hypothetical protein PSHT_00103 [Puccinia striiformis]